MILTDVNVLVWAFRREAPAHERYAGWLNELVRGDEELALHEAPLAGFLRIVTNARIVGRPAPAALALEFVDRMIHSPRARWLSAPDVSWARLQSLLADDPGLTANLVPDALLAAVALAHGCRLATADRGFARFPALAWFDPAR